MALKAFGKAENDEGEWFPFGEDAPFRLRIRRIPHTEAERIEKRHEKGKAFEVVSGIRRPIRDVEAILNTMTDKAIWCWTDSDLEIEIADDEAAKLFGAEVGQVVKLEGKALTAQVKKFVLREIRPFANTENEDGKPVQVDIGIFILKKAMEQQRDLLSEEERAEKN